MAATSPDALLTKLPAAASAAVRKALTKKNVDDPAREIVAWVLEVADTEGFPGRQDVPKALAALGKKHSVIAEALATAKAGKAPPVDLVCLALVRPKSITELNRVQTEQLRIAGKAWAGNDFSASERLTKSKNREPSLAGTVDVRVLGNGAGKALYDVFTCAGDSGMVFRAGTTKKVGEIIQNGIALKDQPLADGLTRALQAKPRAIAKKAIAKKAKTRS